MKLLTFYFKQRQRGLVLGGMFFLIFLATFLLYHLPFQAVLYPAALCALFSIIVFVFDFQRVKHKHKILNNIYNFTDIVTESLPSIDSIEDADYQHIIHMICEKHNDYQTAAKRQYSDMIDYYTLWVHQIKTPIASMRLQLQNEDSVFSRKLSGDLFRIEQYVEMVLTFLRLNSESTDYVIKEHNLDAIVKQSVKKFASEFISRKINLIYEPLNTSVITDEKWLSFVIEQILSNALKYTTSGSVSITLQPNRTLCISDTGMGIAPEDLPRIFENGFTGYNGRSDKKASGIGLYLCKRICTNLGHTIWATSTVGKGTSISLNLSQANLEVE